MKWMIASDLHGSAPACRALLEQYQKEGAQKLILLGDLLYHGPRNDLPEGYAPKEVIALLNPVRNELLCVRGNCEAEVDQMVLQFPVMAEYAMLWIDGITIFATHGHLYHEEHLPPLKDGDILLHGHTHVQTLTKKERRDGGMYYLLNPGSAALPKNGNQKSYMIYENRRFTIKNLMGEPIASLTV